MHKLLALLLLAVSANAAVVARAPSFSWDSAGSRLSTLKSLQGHSVVLIVAPSPDDAQFRKQVKNLRDLYQDFSARKVVFFAAFLGGTYARVPSDIPIAEVSNGPSVAADYGVVGRKHAFRLVVIGPDGNIDMQSAKVSPASKVRDLVINTFAVQSTERKQ